MLTIVKQAGPSKHRWGAHLQATEPVSGQTTESVMHSQCDARPTVTFTVAKHTSLLFGQYGTKLYCLVTFEARVINLFGVNGETQHVFYNN